MRAWRGDPKEADSNNLLWRDMTIMKRILVVTVVALALFPTELALGDVVFVEDFSSSLSPSLVVDANSGWDLTVAGGRANTTKSAGIAGASGVRVNTSFRVTGDFEAFIGIEPQQTTSSVGLLAFFGDGSVAADVFYFANQKLANFFFPEGLIPTGGGITSLSASSLGIVRTGNQVETFYDGNLVAALSDPRFAQAAGFQFFHLEERPGTLGATSAFFDDFSIRADGIVAVPEPNSLLWFSSAAVGLVCIAWKRRRVTDRFC
ncbi:MAG: hypothetical protein R3C19_04950 [Planctomycetaceae bacterium]